MRELEVEQIIKGIGSLDDDERRELVRRLPEALGLSLEDLALLSLAERSFVFWDNEDDARYDEL